MCAGTSTNIYTHLKHLIFADFKSKLVVSVWHIFVLYFGSYVSSAMIVIVSIIVIVELYTLGWANL